MAHCPGEDLCQEACVSTCFDTSLRKFVLQCCDCSDDCDLPGWRSVLALVILALALLLLARRRWFFMPLGRTMGALGCAVLMVGVESSVIPAKRLLDLPGVVDISSLATLFSLTILTGMLDELGWLQLGAKLLARNCKSPLKLLLRVVAVTSITAALFTNDAAVIVLTVPVIIMCDEMSIAVEPFLVTLATTANIGSAATVIGNPQNILIGTFSGISFGDFFLWSAPAVALGLLLNTLGLVIFYRQDIVRGSKVDKTGDNIGESMSIEMTSLPTPFPKSENVGVLGQSISASSPAIINDVSNSTFVNNVSNPLQNSMAPASPHVFIIDDECANSQSGMLAKRSNAQDFGFGDSKEQSNFIIQAFSMTLSDIDFPASLPRDDDKAQVNITRNLVSSSSPETSDELSAGPPLPACSTTISQSERLVTGVIVMFLIAGFSASLSIAWTALAAVVVIAGNATYFRDDNFEPTSILQHTDLPLLVLIGSLFVIMAGIRLTGAIDLLYEGILSVVGQHCNMNGDSLADSFCSSTIILLLSNMCSNVPTVMLLATKVEETTLDDEGDGIAVNVNTRTRVAWLVLAWASTVAGNFALPGSIANLIVAEKAALHYQTRPKGHVRGAGLTFWVHFRYASWTTIPIMLVGSAAIFYTQMPHGPALEPIS